MTRAPAIVTFRFSRSRSCSPSAETHPGGCLAAAYELRPLTLGELLDRGFTIVRRHFVLLAGISLVARVIPMALSAWMVTLTPPGGRMAPEVIPVMALVYLLVFAASLVSQAATVRAVSALYLGEDTGIGLAYAQTRGSLARLVGYTFVAGFAAIACVIACLMPGVIVAGLSNKVLSGVLLIVGGLFGVAIMSVVLLRWSVAVPVLLQEGLPAVAALRRSWALVERHGGRAFLLGLIVVALVIAASMVVALPFQIALLIGTARGHAEPALLAIASVMSSLANSLVAPLGQTLYTLFYYDLRIRKEGFDVAHLMSQLGDASPAPGLRTLASPPGH